MKANLEWNRSVDEEDWEDWLRAFDLVDTDGNGHISAREVPRLFKEHFTIIHDQMHEHRKAQFTPAEEHHFEQDVEHFLEFHADKDAQIMSWDEFQRMMSTFMEHKTEERKALLDVAQHIM
eukprot:g130.t1